MPKIATVPQNTPRLIYLITEDWFFESHFLERALAAKDNGYAVSVAARDNGKLSALREMGINTVALPFRRSGLNPLRELGTLFAILRFYQLSKPQIVHHIALKPVLYGTLAARLSGVRRIVNAPVGMGFVFTSQTTLSRLLRPIVLYGLKLLLNPKGSMVILENGDDLEDLVTSGLIKREHVRLIEGAGVNIEKFAAVPEPSDPPVVVLVARMLADKGIAEFVQAARLLRNKGVAARFLLVGDPDIYNPASIEEMTLRAWNAEGVVEWLGHQSDVAAILAKARVACLPSYREGLPKSLLEAMAAGLPIVTTDVPGCRAAVTDGENGILVPARDASALAEALEKLIADPALCERFGAEGRKRAELRFASPVIIAETLEVYSKLLEA